MKLASFFRKKPQARCSPEGEREPARKAPLPPTVPPAWRIEKEKQEQDKQPEERPVAEIINPDAIPPEIVWPPEGPERKNDDDSKPKDEKDERGVAIIDFSVRPAKSGFLAALSRGVTGIAILAATALGCAPGLGNRAMPKQVPVAGAMHADAKAISAYEFDRRLGNAAKELDIIDARLSQMKRAKSALVLRAVVRKMGRLQKDFGISSPATASEASRVLASLESGRDADAQAKSVGKLASDVEGLRKGRAEEISDELGRLLDGLGKRRGRNARIMAQVDSLIAKVEALKEEEGLKFTPSDSEEAKLLDKAISDAEAGMSRLKSQLSSLREQEMERARKEIAGRVELLERTPDTEFVQRAQTVSEMKVWIERLERLQKDAVSAKP